jgi:hypothetical protein
MFEILLLNDKFGSIMLYIQTNTTIPFGDFEDICPLDDQSSVKSILK